MLFDTTQIALERTIQGAAMRQTALAGNLANANTPGYQRMDVDFHAALQSAMGASDVRTAVERVGFAAQADGAAAMRADGNGVDTDVEAARLAANALEQQAAVQIHGARTAILRSAMGVQ